MQNSNDTGKMIGTLLIGAAIGGILGVLFAPGKGSETRKKIYGKTEGIATALKKQLDAILEEANASKTYEEKMNPFAVNGDGEKTS
jgi:gas vesicle protein